MINPIAKLSAIQSAKARLLLDCGRGGWTTDCFVFRDKPLLIQHDYFWFRNHKFLRPFCLGMLIRFREGINKEYKFRTCEIS